MRTKEPAVVLGESETTEPPPVLTPLALVVALLDLPNVDGAALLALPNAAGEAKLLVLAENTDAEALSARSWDTDKDVLPLFDATDVETLVGKGTRCQLTRICI